jgi:hypothetical protein
MTGSIHSPIHTAFVGTGRLSFFKSPASAHDVPWHVHDDLVAALGVTDPLRAQFRSVLASGPFCEDIRVIATPDGILTIAPHAAPLGLITGAIEAGVVGHEFEAVYIAGTIQALEILAGDLPPMAAFEFCMAAARNSLGVDS